MAGIERYAFAMSAERLKSLSIAANVLSRQEKSTDVDFCHFYNGP